MEWVSAPNIEDARLPPGALAEWRSRLWAARESLERWLERERGQLLPAECAPRWLKLDRLALVETGGIAIRFGDAPSVDSVAGRIGEHPWGE